MDLRNLDYASIVAMYENVGKTLDEEFKNKMAPDVPVVRERNKKS